MHRRTLMAALASTPLATTPLATLRAQPAWPTQGVRLVVPFAAGGPTVPPG